MTRKSPREIESAVEDLESESSVREGDELYEEEREKAAERWGRDEYDNSVGRLFDAYRLAYDEQADWIEALAAMASYIPANLRGHVRRYEEHGEPPPPFPPIPTEEVFEAWARGGEQYGIDAHGLRDRHGDDWFARLFENLYYETERAKAEGTRAVWNPEEVEADIRRWRAAYEETNAKDTNEAP